MWRDGISGELFQKDLEKFLPQDFKDTEVLQYQKICTVLRHLFVFVSTGNEILLANTFHGLFVVLSTGPVERPSNIALQLESYLMQISAN